MSPSFEIAHVSINKEGSLLPTREDTDGGTAAFVKSSEGGNGNRKDQRTLEVSLNAGGIVVSYTKFIKAAVERSLDRNHLQMPHSQRKSACRVQFIRPSNEINAQRCQYNVMKVRLRDMASAARNPKQTHFTL